VLITCWPPLRSHFPGFDFHADRPVHSATLMTDSVETQPVALSTKVEVVSVAGLFREAIRRIFSRESVSDLFT
jgi:phosphoribosylpyrophosphate synthetase